MMAPPEVRPRVEICSPYPDGYFSFVFRIPAVGGDFLGAEFEIIDPIRISQSEWRRLAAGEETAGVLVGKRGGVRCRDGRLEFMGTTTDEDGATGGAHFAWRASVEYFREALLAVVDEAVGLGLID